jgi:hypothetical protein
MRRALNITGAICHLHGRLLVVLSTPARYRHTRHSRLDRQPYMIIRQDGNINNPNLRIVRACQRGLELPQHRVHVGPAPTIRCRRRRLIRL